MFVKYSSLLANFAYLKKKKKKRGNNTRATIPPFVPCLLTCYEGQSGTSFTATNPNHASACIGRPPKVKLGEGAGPPDLNIYQRKWGITIWLTSRTRRPRRNGIYPEKMKVLSAKRGILHPWGGGERFPPARQSYSITCICYGLVFYKTQIKFRALI